MSTMDEIEARAASKAIHTTIQILENAFNVRGERGYAEGQAPFTDSETPEEVREEA